MHYFKIRITIKSEFKFKSFLDNRHTNRMLISFNSIILYLILQAHRLQRGS